MSERKPAQPARSEAKPSEVGRAGRAGLALALVALAGLALLGLWHASPWLLWKLRFEAQLAAEGDARRLVTEHWSALPEPEPEWAELVAGPIALRAPLAREALPACGRCASQCRLPLDNRGTLGIFPDPPSVGLVEARDRHAPDARDVSLWRSVASNWRTIDALTDRLRSSTRPSESFRFEAPGSRGVVTAFHVNGVTRYVVYAYAPDGTAARVIGVAGLERERFEALLGGLRVEPGETQRGARCTPESW